MDDKSDNAVTSRHWLTSQHIPLPPASAASSSEGPAVEEAPQQEVQQETFMRMFVVGGLAGVLETMIVQPLVYWKTVAHLSAAGGPSTWERLWVAVRSPSMLYRGVGVNAASIGPISAWQYASDGFARGLHRQMTQRDATATESLLIASITGALSTVIVTPAELLMILQQRSGGTFLDTSKDILRRDGPVGFLRGWASTGLREAGWTFGFLGLAPVIKQVLKDDSKFFHQNDVAASLAASLMAGQVAATISQPADTIKTMVQAVGSNHLGKTKVPSYASTWSAVMDLYQRQGLGAFWKGLAPRSIRCMGAVFILGQAQDEISRAFDRCGILMNNG